MLICPLTKKLFKDPVVISDGATFERSAIEAWLKDNNTNPLSNETLPNKGLVPNKLVIDLLWALREMDIKKVKEFAVLHMNKDDVTVLEDLKRISLSSEWKSLQDNIAAAQDVVLDDKVLTRKLSASSFSATKFKVVIGDNKVYIIICVYLQFFNRVVFAFGIRKAIPQSASNSIMTV